MHTDKEIMQYLYQERNVKRLEDLIENMPEPKKLPMSKEINTVKDIKEGQHILDEIVYPKLQELIPTEKAEKPELRMYENRLFQQNTNHLLVERIKAELQHAPLASLYFGLLGATAGLLISDQNPYAPLVFGTMGAALGAVAVCIGAVPISLHEHKAQIVRSIGFTEPGTNVIYLKSGRSYDEAIHIIAHETAHRLSLCISYERMMNQPYIREGLAEAVAFEVGRSLYNKINSSSVIAREWALLICAYTDLCDELKIEKEFRKYFQSNFLLTPIEKLEKQRQTSYHIGYAAMRLLQEERGIEVFREIVNCSLMPMPASLPAKTI